MRYRASNLSNHRIFWRRAKNGGSFEQISSNSLSPKVRKDELLTWLEKSPDTANFGGSRRLVARAWRKGKKFEKSRLSLGRWDSIFLSQTMESSLFGLPGPQAGQPGDHSSRCHRLRSGVNFMNFGGWGGSLRLTLHGWDNRLPNA